MNVLSILPDLARAVTMRPTSLLTPAYDGLKTIDDRKLSRLHDCPRPHQVGSNSFVIMVR
jgi:hypothetical protein